MENVWQVLGVIAGVTGVPALVAAAIIKFGKDAISQEIKSAIQSEYDQRLATLKSDLKADNDTKLERHKHTLQIEASKFKADGDAKLESLKHDLAREAAKRNFMFAKLHEQRAEVIAETYSKLAVSMKALRQYTSPMEPAGVPSKADRQKSLYEANLKLNEVFLHKRIFLPLNTAQKIDKIITNMQMASNEFFWKVANQSDDAPTIKAWVEVSDKVSGPISEAMNELEDELRLLLGDDTTDPLVDQK